MLAARFLDRFDRNRLLFLFVGFTLGTFLLRVATTYPLLLAARYVRGRSWRRRCGRNVLAIVGDAFPDARRATATGVVMSAFSVASIAGVRTGILVADVFVYWQAVRRPGWPPLGRWCWC